MTLRLYILEDEEWIRRGLKKMIHFQRLDMELAGEAADSDTATAELLEIKPHILLSDIRVPPYSGLEVVRRVRRELPRMKTIFISGYREFEYAQQAIELQSFRYLLKPVDDEELNDALAQVGEEIREALAGQEKHTRQMIDMLDGTLLADELLQRVCFGVESGDGSQMEALAGEILTALGCAGEDTARLAAACMEIVVNLKRKGYALEAVGMGAAETAGTPKDSLFRLRDWLAALSAELTRARSAGVATSIGRMKEYIDSHYTQDISLSEMADRFYISAPYLSQAFKKTVGRNFQDYILSKRMGKAAEILRQSPLNVADVARIVGYDDVRHFSRMFRKYTGVNPSVFRADGSAPNDLGDRP